LELPEGRLRGEIQGNIELERFLRILVFLKDVCDVKVPVAYEEATGRLKAERNVVMLNPADRSAILCALAFKERAPETHITLVHLGPPSAEPFLREGLALGCDEALRIWDEETDGLGTQARALILSRVAAIASFDLILTGAQSQDIGTGQVGLLVASRLHIPCITSGMAMRRTEENRVVVTKQLSDGSIQHVEAPIPLVVTVAAGEEKGGQPSLSAIAGAEERPIGCLGLAEIGIPLTEIRNIDGLLVSGPLHPPASRLRYIPAPDSSLPAYERRMLLLQGSMKKRQGRIVMGTEDEVAEMLFQTLLDEGWLDDRLNTV